MILEFIGRSDQGVFLPRFFNMRKGVFANTFSYRRLTWGYLICFFVLTKGMGVVGLRPALPKEVATYTEYQAQRLLIKPGITCYWQTRRNRGSITFDEWIDLDL